MTTAIMETKPMADNIAAAAPAGDETWVLDGIERRRLRQERATQADERFVRDGTRRLAAHLAAGAARQEMWLAAARRRNTS